MRWPPWRWFRRAPPLTAAQIEQVRAAIAAPRPLSPETCTTVRTLVRGAIERLDETVALAHLLHGPGPLDTATFERCVLDAVRAELLAISTAPPPEQDAAVVQVLATLSTCFVERVEAEAARQGPS